MFFSIHVRTNLVLVREAFCDYYGTLYALNLTYFSHGFIMLLLVGRIFSVVLSYDFVSNMKQPFGWLKKTFFEKPEPEGK